MPLRHDDDVTIGRVLARREVLALFGTTVGAAALATCGPGRLARRIPFGAATSFAADPPCVVRPEQTEGPYFVDERLNRSDIRSDPTTGEIKPGALFTLTFVVSRLDGDTCSPFANSVVDLWHCDAAGIYADVQDSRFDTTGQQFLRGYQVTDADGVARFVTIFPGWYQGRAVHLHFKIRTAPDAATGLEFTSQLYFDDELSDVVLGNPPYAARGQRTTRNANDAIYGSGGDQLLLAPSTDGAGGYVATFEIGIEANGATTTTTTPSSASTTTTRPAAASCASIAACLANVRSALPDPAAASTRRARLAALGLRRRTNRLATLLDRAGAAAGSRRNRLYARAEDRLAALRTASTRADRRGTLGVPLAPIQAAIGALADLV